MSRKIELTLPDEMFATLSDYAADHEYSRAAAVRYAIKRLLAQNKYPKDAKTPPPEDAR